MSDTERLEARTREVRFVDSGKWVAFPDADHALHPTEPHNCRCACSERVSFECFEHGRQVARQEFRYVTAWRTHAAVADAVLGVPASPKEQADA